MEIGRWHPAARRCSGSCAIHPSAMTPPITSSARTGRLTGLVDSRLNASAPLTDKASMAGIAKRAGARMAPNTGSSINHAYTDV